MRHRRKRHRLGRTSSHRESTMQQLSTALFREERIYTTLAKAKALRPYAEPLVTQAKKDTLHARRLVLRKIKDKAIMRKLFDSIGPRCAERNGGYFRIIKAGNRVGDFAPMAYIELVDRVVEEPETTTEEEPKKGRLGGLFGGGK